MNEVQIFKGNIAYTKCPDRFELTEQGYIIVENGSVRDVLPELPDTFKNIPAIDMGERIIIPAFTDLHLHAPQIPNNGIGYDKELLPWLNEYTFPLESRFTDLEYAEKVFSNLIKDLWKYGNLHSVILSSRHKEATELLIGMLTRSRLYAYAGKVNMDRNASCGLAENTEDSIRETEELVQKYANRNSRIKYIISPRFVPCTTAPLMEALGKLAKKYDVPVQSHLSENHREVEWVKELHPEEKNFASIYDRYGLLGQTKTVMAHCIHNTDEELALLKKNGVFIAHCPQSNLNLSSGIMPLRKHLNMGLNIGLGSDVGGGNTLNMFTHMMLAIQASKMYAVQHEGCPPVSSAEAFYLSTKGGGGFFGKTGSFEKGYAFDALVLDDSELNIEKRPLKDRIEKLIYCGDDRNIAGRYLEGEQVPSI